MSRIDWRSCERQGSELPAEVHEGCAVRALEKKGVRTDKGLEAEKRDEFVEEKEKIRQESGADDDNSSNRPVFNTRIDGTITMSVFISIRKAVKQMGMFCTVLS